MEYSLDPMITYPETPSGLNSSEWMPLIKLPETISYLRFKDSLSSRGIDTRPCFTPIHKMKGFKNCRKIGKLEVCSRIHSCAFNLPSYPDLTEKQLTRIVEVVNKVVKEVG